MSLTLMSNSSGRWRCELGFEGGPGGFGANSWSGDRDQSGGDASPFGLEHRETRQGALRGLHSQSEQGLEFCEFEGHNRALSLITRSILIRP
jgi:hypothetical protein